MAVRVKICGVSNLEDARAAVTAGAWAIGLNFYSGSRRYIGPERAATIAEALREKVLLVGVFVNASRQQVQAVHDRVGLSMLQFHGDESPADCAGWQVPTIRAIRVRDRTAVESARRYDVDFILADAYVEGAFGGTGRTVDTTLLGELDPSRLILAGGLTPDNVAAAVAQIRPFAVDVAGGVEREAGLKDASLIRRFIENANAA